MDCISFFTVRSPYLFEPIFFLFSVSSCICPSAFSSFYLRIMGDLILCLEKICLILVAKLLAIQSFPALSYTGLFISPSGISELDCATTKTDTAERSISIGRESLQVFFVLGALAYFQVPPLGGSR